jgi:hypothetical protein
MKILGLNFNDDATMEEVNNELKRRGLNPENRTIPIFYAQEKMRLSNIRDHENLSAQHIIDIVKMEEAYGN